MKDELNKIKSNFLKEIENISSINELEILEKKYLGRKNGKLTLAFKKLPKLAVKERPIMGKLANEIKKEIEEKIQRVKLKWQETGINEKFDMTLPGRKIERGHLHPITQFLRKINKVFTSMGFEVVEGREIETEKYNFDLLNIPADHPARDMWDTFYIKDQKKDLLLRTHTSPMQIRAMGKRRPPVRLIVPGRVFRHENVDASHETTFYQCEGLVIDENITATNLIGTLKIFLQEIFGEKVKIRVRPSYFPFVEPGMEVDMSCLICGGKGCSVCKQTGWLEMLGAGMVHPNVLKNMKIDSRKYSGFAFGVGVDRLMMLYYGINDVRLSYSSDLRFIKQF